MDTLNIIGDEAGCYSQYEAGRCFMVNYGITLEKFHLANVAFTCQHEHSREQFLVALNMGLFETDHDIFYSFIDFDHTYERILADL